jgi:hypothetical protein
MKEPVTTRRRLGEVKDTARMRFSFVCYGVDHRFGHPLRLCEKPSRAKAQRAPSVAETMVNAQLTHWFQAVEIKIRQIAFVLPTITPKKSQNMSRIFFGWDIFFTTLGTRKGLGAANVGETCDARGQQVPFLLLQPFLWPPDRCLFGTTEFHGRYRFSLSI